MKKINRLLLIFLLIQLCAYGRKDTKLSLEGQSLSFRENKGQVRDQYGAIRKDIDFVLQSKDVTLFIGKGQLHYQFARKHKEGLILPAKQSSLQSLMVPGSVDISRVDMTLGNADQQAALIKGNPDKEIYRYYRGNPSGNEDAGKVFSYRKITYRNIYPFIDWVLYVQGNRFKYDFVVHPGGKVSDIRLQYAGTETLKLTKDGSLHVGSPLGTITEEPPYAYEEKGGQKVASQFSLIKNVAGFKLGDYKGTVVIDPGVQWGTYFGGSDGESSTKVACDHHGNVYITGGTTSLSNLATTGAHQTVYSGSMGDAFLAKFDSTGELQWATYYGGDSGTGFYITTQSFSVACDTFGHVYIAGITTVADAIGTPGTYQPNIGTNAGLQGFLAQFNTDGVRNWGTYYGASIPVSAGIFTNSTFVYSTSCDKQGNVYIGCHTDSVSSTGGTLSSPGAHQTVYGGGETDALLVKFDSTGNRLWSTYYGGSGVDYIFSTVCDDSNNIYIAGLSNSPTGIATPGTHESTMNPEAGGFVAKFNSNGVRQWGSYINGQASAIALDTFQNIYVAGYTQGGIPDTFIYTPGAYLSTLQLNSQWNGFVIKFNAQNGTRKWGTYYGAEAPTFIEGVACDPEGNVFLAGYTGSYAALTTETIATAGSHQDTLNAPPGLSSPPEDAFLVQFDSSGTRKWATYYGGPAIEYGKGVACDPSGAIYLTGYTESTSAIATPGAHQTLPAGGNDVFLVRFLPVDIALKTIITPGNDTICSGDNPLSVLVKNEGRMDKTDTLAISYHYSGPAIGSLDTFFTDDLLTGMSDTLNLGLLDFPFPGTYDLTIYLKYTRDDNDHDNDTIHVNLTVTNALPIADISVSQIGTVFHFSNNNAQSSDQYQWDFGDSETSTLANPSHQYAVSGSYIVTLIVTNFCSADTATVTVEGIGNSNSIHQAGQENSILIFPNPTDKILHIKNTGNAISEEYIVTNLQGQTIQYGSLKGKSSITLTGLASGSYFLRIKTNKGWIAKQFQIVND